jgi:membrane protein required for colicin V production
VNADVVIAPVATSAWSIVDMALALGLFLSVLVGAWRGLVTEMLSLFGWGVAYFAAQWWGPRAGASVPVGEVGSRVNVLAGMMVVFISAWIAWAVVSWALRQIVKASGLSGTDRLLGAVFGLIRGVLVALVVFTLVSMTPMTQWAPWHDAKAVPWLGVVLDGLRPMLPDDVVKYLPSAQADTDF